jgi:AraC-like DNA-binding protein
MTFHDGSHDEVEVGIIAEDFCAIDTDDPRFTIVSKRAISRDHALLLDPKNVTYQPITTRHREGAVLERAESQSLNILTKGACEIRRGSQRVRLQPGSVLSARKGMELRFCHAETVPDDTCISVVFPPRAIDEDPALCQLLRELPIVTSGTRSRVMYFSNAIYTALKQKRHSELEDLVAALPSMLLAAPDIKLTGHVSPSQLNWYIERIHYAQQAIRHNPASDLRIATLGRAVGMSPFHFARVFLELAGITPHAFVRKTRLAFARKMLEDGASVSQACVGSGFVSVSHFSRAFKREYLGSPSRHAASDRSKGMERQCPPISKQKR